MFAKVDVNGFNQHPVWKHLKNEQGELFGSVASHDEVMSGFSSSDIAVGGFIYPTVAAYAASTLGGKASSTFTGLGFVLGGAGGFCYAYFKSASRLGNVGPK